MDYPSSYICNAKWNVSSEQNFESLSDEERTWYSQQVFDESHGGHESVHTLKVVIILLLVGIFQICLMKWKKYYFGSYLRISLLAAWIMPLVSSNKKFDHFNFTWIIYTAAMCYVIYKLHDYYTYINPRYSAFLVFYSTYLFTAAVGLLGLCIMYVSLTDTVVFRNNQRLWWDVGIPLSFYGIYYSLLSRAIAVVITDRIAPVIKHFEPPYFPNRRCHLIMCGLCTKFHVSQDSPDFGYFDKACSLSCDHVFHEICYFVWRIMGKKRSCPFCEWGVSPDLGLDNKLVKAMVFYGDIMDTCLHLLVWWPLICATEYFMCY